MQVIIQRTWSLFHKLQKYIFCNLCAIVISICFQEYLIDAKAYAENSISYVELRLNHASQVALPIDAASAVVANPDYVDILSQSGTSLILVGKRLGESNLFIRDRNQDVILNLVVTVKADAKGDVSIYRGTGRIDYSCIDLCKLIPPPSDVGPLISSASDPKIGSTK